MRALQRAADDDLRGRRCGREGEGVGDHRDQEHTDRGTRPGHPSRREQLAPPGQGRCRPLPGLLHQPAPQRRPKRGVERGLRAATALQELRGLPQLRLVREDPLQLGVAVPGPVAVRAVTGPAHAQVSMPGQAKMSGPIPESWWLTDWRTLITPRWISSFTAPLLFPITPAMSSIFMSSWNLRTIAVRCGLGRVSTTAQIRRSSSRWAAICSRAGPPA